MKPALRWNGFPFRTGNIFLNAVIFSVSDAGIIGVSDCKVLFTKINMPMDT